MKMKPAFKAGLIVGAFSFTINAAVAPLSMLLMLCSPTAIVLWLLWLVMGAVAGWLTVTFAETPLEKPGQQGIIAGFIVTAMGVISTILVNAVILLLGASLEGYEIAELFSVSPEDLPNVLMLWGVTVGVIVTYLVFFSGASLLASYMMAKYKTAQKLVQATVTNQSTPPHEPVLKSQDTQLTSDQPPSESPAQVDPPPASHP